MDRAGIPRHSRTTARARDVYVAAALLPLAPAVATVVTAWEPGTSPVTPALLRSLTPDTLLYSAACVLVAAPLAGVAVASRRVHGARRRSPGEDTGRLSLAALIFCAVSALLTLARLGVSRETLWFVWTSHAVLASVTLALAGLGALMGSLFSDPLDAAASSLVVAAIAGYGVLVAGGPVGDASPVLVKAALLASPVMSIASAAHVDLVRTDIWYQVSPLAHIQVEYPSWSVVCSSYLLAGSVAFLGMAWRKGWQ